LGTILMLTGVGRTSALANGSAHATMCTYEE
jgi:hypothetical protein